MHLLTAWLLEAAPYFPLLLLSTHLLVAIGLFGGVEHCGFYLRNTFPHDPCTRVEELRGAQQRPTLSLSDSAKEKLPV